MRSEALPDHLVVVVISVAAEHAVGSVCRLVVDKLIATLLLAYDIAPPVEGTRRVRRHQPGGGYCSGRDVGLEHRPADHCRATKHVELCFGNAPAGAIRIA